MRIPRLFLSFLALTWLGCSESGDHGIEPTPIEVSGPISTNRTWSGTVQLTADAEIAAGVQVTVTEGTVFEAADGAVLQVHGGLAVNGTAQKPVSMRPAAAAAGWGGIVVESGGVARIHHATGSDVATLLTCKAGALASLIEAAMFSGLGQALDASSEVSIEKSVFEDMSTNAMEVRAGGNVTIIDSVFRGAPGDLVIVSGGALTVSYCDFGSNATSEHGGVFVSSSTQLNVSYSNLISAEYGISIGSTSNAVVQYNNFVNNDNDVGDLGSNVSVDMSSSYWDSGPPSLGGAFNFASPSAMPISSAGPRP